MSEVLVPHVGWLAAPEADRVVDFLQEGWFEFREQAFFWLLLRPEDTVVDCGAHLGLFSVLAARAMEDRGRILCVEPNPDLIDALEKNLDNNDVTCAKVVQGAVFSASGPVTLRVGAAGHSAYSSLYDAGSGYREVGVAAVTIDELLESEGIEHVDLLKLDVEGAELDVLAGCAGSIAAGRLPLVSVEFSEKVLEAADRDTASLAAAWAEQGYAFCRFDRDTMQLTEVEFDCPIWYENLLAIRDRSWVEERLAEAPEPRRRIAREILGRGAAVSRLNDDRDRLRNEVALLTQNLGTLERHREEQLQRVAGLEQRVLCLSKALQDAPRPLSTRLARALARQGCRLAQKLRGQKRRG